MGAPDDTLRRRNRELSILNAFAEALNASVDLFGSKAGEIHRFVNVGNVPLVHLDVHLSERFIQENLD